MAAAFAKPRAPFILPVVEVVCILIEARKRNKKTWSWQDGRDLLEGDSSTLPKLIAMNPREIQESTLNKARASWMKEDSEFFDVDTKWAKEWEPLVPLIMWCYAMTAAADSASTT